MRLDRSLLSFTANQPIQRYAPWVIGPTAGEFKLQVVLEALQSDGTDAEVARAYDIHPVAHDVRLRETTRGSDNRCHHVVTKVVTMGQGYSLKTAALLRYEDLFEEPPTSYEVC